MMIIFVFQITGPYLNVVDELFPYFYVRVVYECSEVVNVVTCLVEIFDRHRIGIAKAYEILEHEGIVLPHSTS